MSFIKNSATRAVVVSLSILVLLQGCSRNISSEVYTADAVGEAQETYAGVIVAARKVRVRAGEKFQDNSTGGTLGAGAGAVAGSAVSGGGVAGTLGGAVVGGIAGMFAERAVTGQDGVEYTVKLDKGSLMTVVQAVKPIMVPGQRVFVVVAHKSKKYGGRSRVIPDLSVRK